MSIDESLQEPYRSEQCPASMHEVSMSRDLRLFARGRRGGYRDRRHTNVKGYFTLLLPLYDAHQKERLPVVALRNMKRVDQSSNQPHDLRSRTRLIVNSFAVRAHGSLLESLGESWVSMTRPRNILTACTIFDS